MSVNSPDSILRLPYDASLTLAGVEYAKTSLHYTYNRMGLDPAARLRKIVAGVAVELAFRRWLEAQAIPYDLLGATAFTEKDRYDLCLGGRRCDIKSFLISDREHISELRRDPAWLLDASALVPEDQFQRSALAENDLYVFGFLAGLETRDPGELERALRARQPVYLLHTLPEDPWLGHEAWRSLGLLAFSNRGEQRLAVEVGGQGAERTAIMERLKLPPGGQVQTAQEYYSLLYVRVPRLPAGPVQVRSAALDVAHYIAPGAWKNIWIYGLEIFIAGWLTKAEFRALAQILPARSAVKQYRQTQVHNRAVPVSELRPVAELAQLVKSSEWGKL